MAESVQPILYTVEELVRAYGDELVRYAFCYVKNSAAAEDIMEEAFATLFIKRKKPSAPKAYLFKIVRNKSIDHLRKNKRVVPLSDVSNVLVSENPEQDILKEERNKTLYLRMQQLPSPYRGILHLVYLEGFTPKEASKILKLSQKQVYNLLARAKQSLSELYGKENENEIE